MTRINVIEPALLADQHLIAEYRELPRVFAIARPLRPCERGAYVMGTGHVRFFFERTGWLSRRQVQIIAECLNRGIAVQHVKAPTPISGLDGDWHPTADDLRTNLDRLIAKVADKPGWYRFRGEIVADDFYTRHLKR